MEETETRSFLTGSHLFIEASLFDASEPCFVFTGLEHAGSVPGFNLGPIRTD